MSGDASKRPRDPHHALPGRGTYFCDCQICHHRPKTRRVWLKHNPNSLIETAIRVDVQQYMCACPHCNNRPKDRTTWLQHNPQLRIQDAKVVTREYSDDISDNNHGHLGIQDTKVPPRTIRPTSATPDLLGDINYEDNPPDLGDISDNDNNAAMDMDMDMDMNLDMDIHMDMKHEQHPPFNLSWLLRLQQMHVPIPDLSTASDNTDHSDSDATHSDSSWTSDTEVSDSEDDSDLHLSVEDMTDMLDLGQKPLYLGSDTTVLAVVTALFSAQARFKTKQVVLKSHFDILLWILPHGHNLPTYEVSRRMMRYFGGIDVQHIPCCAQPKCDFLFYDRPRRHDPNGDWQHASLTACPRCGHPKNDAQGKPRKTFTWLGINQQLKNRYYTYYHATLFPVCPSLCQLYYIPLPTSKTIMLMLLIHWQLL